MEEIKSNLTIPLEWLKATNKNDCEGFELIKYDKIDMRNIGIVCGSICLIECLKEIQNNQIILLKMDNDYYIRRYQESQHPNTVRLIEHNSLEIAKTYNINDIEIVGVVTKVVTDLS